MKIAFVITSEGIGGTEIQMELLRAALVDQGHTVETHVLEGGGDNMLENGSKRYYYGLKRERTVLSIVNGGLALLRLRRRLLGGGYDAVHAAMARAHVTVPFLLLGAAERPRLVAWRRNLGIHLGSSRLGLMLERAAARGTDSLIFNSQAVMEYWAAAGVRSRENVVIPNGLGELAMVPECKVDDVYRDIAPWNSGSKIVISVGNLRPVKRHDLLLASVAKLKAWTEWRLCRPIVVVILGEGEERQRLEEQAFALGVRLHLPGRVDNVRDWLAGADLFVHASDSEGSSNAILEAMVMGLPIVATDVGGARESVGGAGLLVPAGDVFALASGMQKIVEDDVFARRLGSAAREKAEREFAIDAVAQAHVAVYKNE